MHRLLMKACSTLSLVTMTNNGDRLKSAPHLSMQLVWVNISYAVQRLGPFILTGL